MTRNCEKQLIFYSGYSCCSPVLALIAIGAGNFLRVASNRLDTKDPTIVRDVNGNFVAIILEQKNALYFYDLRSGMNVEP